MPETSSCQSNDFVAPTSNQIDSTASDVIALLGVESNLSQMLQLNLGLVAIGLKSLTEVPSQPKEFDDRVFPFRRLLLLGLLGQSGCRCQSQ